MAKPDKTSLVIDREKVAEAKAILGTPTLDATVDAALDEVIKRDKSRELMERIRRDGGLGPSPEQLCRLRSPRRLVATCRRIQALGTEARPRQRATHAGPSSKQADAFSHQATELSMRSARNAKEARLRASFVPDKPPQRWDRY
jgi:hypothetical protein